MQFFTSDTHFYHDNIIKYSNRPFKNSLEMNEIIINNWNKVVTASDTIYHLGDVGFACVEVLNETLKRLNGNIIFLTGNHDRSMKGLAPIKHLLEINIEGQPIVLMHYAMYVWPKSHYGSWHLFGHSHGTLKGVGKSFDVGVDANNFTPISFDQVKNIMVSLPDHPGLLSNRR